MGSQSIFEVPAQYTPLVGAHSSDLYRQVGGQQIHRIWGTKWGRPRCELR